MTNTLDRTGRMTNLSSLLRAFLQSVVFLQIAPVGCFAENATSGPCGPLVDQLLAHDETTSSLLPCHLSVVNSLLQRLGWKRIILVVDDETELLAASRNEYTSEVMFALIECKLAWTAVGLENFITLGPMASRQQTNVLVLGGSQCFRDVLSGSSRFEERNRMQTALHMTSRWVFLSRGPLEEKEAVFNASTMDNVILLELPDSPSPLVATVWTLMWRPGGRQFQLVQRTSDCVIHRPVPELFPNTQFGLNGKTFKLVTMETAPYFMTKTEGVYDGLVGELIQAASVLLNCTFEYDVRNDDIYGTKLSNGTWIGMVGAVVNGKADLVFSMLSRTPDRDEVVDFSVTYLYDDCTFAYRSHALESKLLTYLKPFRWPVLLCIGVVVIAMMGLTIVLRLHGHADSNGSTLLDFWEFGDIALHTYGAVVLRASPRLPETGSSRVLVGAWWLLCLVMAAIYTGNLVAFLTATRHQIPIRTLQDLVSQDTYKWGAKIGTNYPDTISTSNASIFKKVWSGIVRFNKTDPEVLSTDFNVHVRKMLTENYATIAGRLELKQAAYDNNVSLTFSTERFIPDELAVVFPNNSAYTYMMSDAILVLRDRGIYSHLYQKWLNFDVPETSASEPHAVTLEDAQTAFYVLLSGWMAASLLLLVEYFIARALRGQSRGQEIMAGPAIDR